MGKKTDVGLALVIGGCAAGLSLLIGMGAGPGAFALTDSPEPGEIEEIACKNISIARYRPMWEYSFYGESTEEWQEQGLVSTHVCDDWKLTTNIPQHRALAEAIAVKLERESIEYTWIPESSEVKVTAEVTGENQGELLELSIDGETIWSGEENYDIRELNVLEQWVLDALEDSFCWNCDYMAGFDTPLCSQYAPNLSEPCDDSLRNSWHDIPKLTHSGEYSPAETLARFEAIGNILYGEKVFAFMGGPAGGGGWLEWWVKNSDGSDLEPWGREEGWQNLYKVPESGKIAFEAQMFESCTASGDFNTQDCTWERLFEVPVRQGDIVSLYGRHQRLAIHAELLPFYYMSTETRELVENISRRVKPEDVDKYLPEKPYAW